MLSRLVFLAVALTPARAEFRDVLKSADIDAELAAGREALLLERPAYAIRLKVLNGQPGSVEISRPADQILHVRKGHASVTLAGRRQEVGPGDFIHIPRTTAHTIDPGGGRLEFVVVSILPTGDNLPTRQGFLGPRRMPHVLKKADIDSTIEANDRNQPLHSSPGYTLNYVIYPSLPGPWEAHRECVDIYFVQRGTAKALLGGEITNPREESPGEIRGDGVKGAREYDIGPGDMVHIPRNGAHHMIPGRGKLAYLLLKIWAE